MKEKLTDILITYVDKHTSKSTQVQGDFDGIVNQIGLAKKEGALCVFNGFAVNPHYILTIKDITKGEIK